MNNFKGEIIKYIQESILKSMPDINTKVCYCFFVFLLSFFVVNSNSIANCQYGKADSMNITRCTICRSGYQLNLDYNRCLNCTSIHSACLHCDVGPVFCQVCDYGFKVVNGTCSKIVSCPQSNCLDCYTNRTACTYCQNGYFVNGSICSPCPYLGQLDNFDGTCSCDFGFYLAPNNHTCQPCQYPCQECSGNSNNCTQCIYGFYRTNISGSCGLCLIPNCIICSNNGTLCSNCTLGYVLTNGVCSIQLQTLNIENYINLPEFYYFCMPGCFYCYKYDFCVSCIQGYSRDLYTDSCLPCSVGCKRCESLLGMVCFQCYSGYRLGNNSCVACKDSNCVVCNSSQKVCTVCLTGFVVQNVSCYACASNCINCSISGPSQCDQNSCQTGFARVSSSQCALCALGCFSCSAVDLTTCFSCPLGSFQVVGGQCQVCPQGCINCSSAFICRSCRAGYRLINNVCYQTCTYPCLDCSPYNPRICSSCFSGYALSEDYTCLSNIGCNQNTNCQICPVGYYLDIATLTCIACKLQQNCIKCETQATKCAICVEGYYVFENKCLPCISNCVKCQLQTFCFQCSNGYYLMIADSTQVYGSCESCSSNCLTCIDESNKCNSCAAGYTLIGFTCVTQQNILFQINMQHKSIQESNSEVIAFIKEVVPFTNYIAQMFGPPYSRNPSLLYLKDISAGSISVTYMASVANYDPRLLLNSITQSLNGMTSYNDFSIIGTQIVGNGFQQNQTIQPPAYDLYISLVPSPIFLVCIFLLTARFIKRKRMANQGHLQKVQSQTRKEIKLEPLETQKNLNSQAYGAITM